MGLANRMRPIAVFDTLLRDGCQSADINFSVHDKIELVKAMDDFGIDYIELGWPGASRKEMEAFNEVQKVSLRHSKIVAFGSTRRISIKAEDDQNLQAIVESNAPVACIFGKTWKEHIQKQLNATPEQNLQAISDSIRFLKGKGLRVFYDLEHFFDGFKNDREYALACIREAAGAGAEFAVLCDTNGGTLLDEVHATLNVVRDFLEKENISINLGVHFHNDCGLGVANSLIAASEGASMIQGTLNGFGERTGNADLSQIIPNLVLKMGFPLPSINLGKLTQLCNIVYMLANQKPETRKPFVGKNAFSHKGGIHVDAIMKGASYEHINPTLVGNQRDIILSDLSGKANIIEVLKKFGIQADKKDPKVEAMLHAVEDLEARGYDIGTVPAEQFLLKERFFGASPSPLIITQWTIISGKENQEYSECSLKGAFRGDPVEGNAKVAGGPVDAIFQAIKNILKDVPYSAQVSLINYKVVIAHDRGAESSVRVFIEFKGDSGEWGTVGVSANILEASLEAIQKGMGYFLANHPPL